MVSGIHMVKDCFWILGNMSKKCMSNHMDDFSVLKFFGISTRPGKVSVHVQVYWDFPVVGWTKVNTDSAARGSLGPTACAGRYLQRESQGIYWWFFVFMVKQIMRLF